MSRIPLAVPAGHRIGSNPTSPQSSPSPPFTQHSPHHHHYRNHNRSACRPILTAMPAPPEPTATTSPSMRSPPKFEAFVMTGDLMINLASKQTTDNLLLSQMPQDSIPFRRKKQPAAQNIHTSSIQFGDENCRQLSATLSLPNSPQQTASPSDVAVRENCPHRCPPDEEWLIRLSKSENQLLVCDERVVSQSSSNGNRVVPLDDEGQSGGAGSRNESVSSSSQQSGAFDAGVGDASKPGLECESSQVDQREAEKEAVAGDDRRGSKSESLPDQQEMNRTFNKKDIQRLHAERNSSPPASATECIAMQQRPDNSFTDCLTASSAELMEKAAKKQTNGIGVGSSESHVNTSCTTPPAGNNICEPRRYPSFLAGSDDANEQMQITTHNLRADEEGNSCRSPEPGDFGSGKQRSSAKCIDVASATRLAKRLYDLQGFKKSDVSRHLSKNNDFGKVVAEEYAKLFDFTGDTLDSALRKFLSRFSLVGETQERQRVLEHFSNRFLICNPSSFKSIDAVFTLTCALMLLNTDLHGESVGRRMTCGEFVDNLSRLPDGQNFPIDVLKAVYASIKSDALPWALDEDDGGSVIQSNLISLLGLPDRSDSRVADQVNPFLGVPSGSATEFRKGFIIRKCCYDPGGKKTPFGKRGWKTFYATLRDLVLYLHKDEHGFRKNQMYESLKNSIRIHHSLASKASDYEKKDFVFRLQTSDQAEYLFKVCDARDQQQWIDAINIAAASLSAPPLAPAVASEPKFQRPLLPVSHTKFGLRDQFLDHEKRISKLEQELELHLSCAPERSAPRRIFTEYTEKQLYLQFELRRYRIYSHLLKVRLQQSLGSQVLEKVMQKSLLTASKSKPLTSYSIGEENDDPEEDGKSETGNHTKKF